MNEYPLEDNPDDEIRLSIFCENGCHEYNCDDPWCECRCHKAEER